MSCVTLPSVRRRSQVLPLEGAVRRVPELDVLPPVSAMEVAGAAAHHLQDFSDVPGSRKGRLRRSLRLSVQERIL
jgi:hypothetical protein